MKVNMDLEKFFGLLRKIRLSAQEKDLLRHQILTFVRQRAPVRQVMQEGRSNFLRFLIWERKPVMFGIIVALIIAVSGGTSVAAQGAVPGDFLFPVKIHVVEPVRLAFATSTEAKGKVEADIAAERLAEAEKVSARGELSADVRAKIEANFEEFAKRVEDRIAALEAAGKTEAAADLRANFEVALKVHDRILAVLADREKDDAGQLKDLAKTVKASVQTAVKARAEAEAKVRAEGQPAVEAAARGKMNAAENKIAEVKSFLGKVEGRLSAEDRAEVQAKLDAADKAFAEGKTELDAKNFAAAFASFGDAARLAQEAKLEAKAEVELKIDLRHEEKAEMKEDRDEQKEEMKAEEERQDEGKDRGKAEVKVELQHEGRTGIDLNGE